MGKQEEVEVAVAVVIQEIGLTARVRIHQTVRGGLFFEDGDAVGVRSLVDVELVDAPLERQVAGVAHVDVEQAVTVDVSHRHARLPGIPTSGDAGLIRDVFEAEVALVEIQPVVGHISGEIEVVQAVAVQVSDGHARAVREILEEQLIAMRRRLLGQDVREVNSRPPGRQGDEKRLATVRRDRFFPGRAARQKQEQAAACEM